MDDTSNEYKTSIFDAVELQVNGILNPTLHEHSLLQSFVSVGIDNTDAKQSNEESKNVNKKARARHCLGKNEENNDLDNRETDNGDSNKTKRTNKRFKEKMDTSFIEVQVQMQKSRLKQRSNNAPRQEEIYTDKDRAAAVNMGSKDIKQSLKQKKRQDRDKSPLLSDIAEPGSVLELGKREMRLGNVNAAFNFINKALELSPNDANALIARSRCYLLLGNPQNALQDAETALQCKLKDSVNARAVYYKAEALYYLGDFEMSLVYYYRGMKMRPEFGQFRLGVQKAKDAIRNILNHGNTCVRHMMDYIPELLIPPTTSDYQPITEKEASDLKQLIEGCDYAVSNAELFMETLSKDLSILDGENVRLVLGSEPQVAQLMKSIEAAVEEASMVEARLAAYDEALGRIREVMARVGQKNQAIHTANNNASFLLEQLSTAISQLDIPANYQRILNETDLPGGREELSLVGISLLKAMTAPLPLGLDKLSAVTEQKKRLEKLKTKFSVIVARHLNNLFIHLGNDTGENINSSELILPTHEAVHHELEPYTELMQLLRALDNKAFMQLAKVYRDTMSKLYKRDLKHFFEIAKNKLISKRLQAHASKGSGQKAEDLINPAPMCLLSAEVWPPISEGRFLDMVLDGVLSQMQPVCLAEQAFCISFLQLDSVLTPSNSNEMEETECVNNGAASPGSVTSTASKKLERQVNEEVRATMSAIFPSLETELNNFIAFLDKVDSFWCMYVLVRLSQHVMSAQDTGSFLSMTFASALIQVKRGFDKFMQAQQHSILMDTKVNRRHKCGILPYVANFGLFAKTAEKIFKHSDRKVDLEKWYTKLVGTIFEAIVIHSKEHHKTPPEVIKMENFHHMYDLLSQVKISVLDQERKEAKQRYQEALRAYVIQYFGRPLEKLNLFFEGVQAKVGAGVKESEISYQMAFSKLELRRVIKEYPAREVKKGLENLYRKVEKHLCEEENLLQVVWREMQGEFIAQYIYIEELVRRCYPDSMVTLEFTTQDILEFFSEIARSH